jgi:hypothetical protein
MVRSRHLNRPFTQEDLDPTGPGQLLAKAFPYGLIRRVYRHLPTCPLIAAPILVPGTHDSLTVPPRPDRFATPGDPDPQTDGVTGTQTRCRA